MLQINKKTRFDIIKILGFMALNIEILFLNKIDLYLFVPIILITSACICELLAINSNNEKKFYFSNIFLPFLLLPYAFKLNIEFATMIFTTIFLLFLVSFTLEVCD